MPLPIRLIRANNPSALTGTGTNSYIVGRGEVAVIDPGPDLDSHLAALLAALDPGERITTILLTHAHLDHSALVPRLVETTGAPVLAFGPATAGRSAVMTRLAAEGLTGDEGADPDFVPDHALGDGDSVAVGDHQITAWHLPGHMGCHMGFAVGDVLFSGDHVMDWSSTLVSPPDGDMAAYMASLRRLAGRHWSRFLPGHGPAVTDPARRLDDLTRHRLAREAAILAALHQHGPSNAAALAARIYTDTPPHLLGAATRNVLAHLIDLTDRACIGLATNPARTALAHATFGTRD